MISEDSLQAGSREQYPPWNMSIAKMIIIKHEVLMFDFITHLLEFSMYTINSNSVPSVFYSSRAKALYTSIVRWWSCIRVLQRAIRQLYIRSCNPRTIWMFFWKRKKRLKKVIRCYVNNSGFQLISSWSEI